MDKDFVIQIGDIDINVEDISDDEWTYIKKLTRDVLSQKITNDIGRAYIIAFLIYVSELGELSRPYDKETDGLIQ